MRCKPVILVVVILIVSLISIQPGQAGDKTSNDKTFKAGAAESYEHQTNDKVTIGAKVFDTLDHTRTAFGKADLNRYGVLPILVVIENKRDKTVDLRSLEVSYVSSTGRHIHHTPPEDIAPLAAPQQRPQTVPQVGIPFPKWGSRKNPLGVPEITSRAFSAKMLPPGDSADGFFYFQTGSKLGAKLYLNGLREIPSNKDIFYFEFPVESSEAPQEKVKPTRSGL